MSIRSRIDKLAAAAGRDKPPSSIPPYDAAALRALSPDELLRLHRRALTHDGDAPDSRAVAELRTLPREQLLERHRRALGLVGEK